MQNSDVELIRTADRIKKSNILNALVKARVSYLERWEKVPFFERKNYGGKKEVCVIYVNANQQEQAREILDMIENKAVSSEDDDKER